MSREIILIRCLIHAGEYNFLEGFIMLVGYFDVNMFGGKCLEDYIYCNGRPRVENVFIPQKVYPEINLEKIFNVRKLPYKQFDNEKCTKSTIQT